MIYNRGFLSSVSVNSKDFLATHERAVQSPFQNHIDYRDDVGPVNLPIAGCRSQDNKPLSWLDIGMLPKFNLESEKVKCTPYNLVIHLNI